MLYKISNGSVTIGKSTILEEINFEIKDKEKIAIVGRNGSGKTTFLKALIDNSLFEEKIGSMPLQISKVGNFTIGYLKQSSFADENITMYDEIKKAVNHIIKIEEKLEYISNNKDMSNDKVLNKYLTLQDEYEYLGGYTYKKEIEVLISRFGFTKEDKNKKIGEFSGGQKTKIAFIKLLLSKPDLLLLDEPTNHLDISSIEWLEDYLKNYPKAIILVSHDRMFLNNIVNTIYEIEYGTFEKYSGNYSYYEKEKKLRYERRLKDYEYQQKEIARLNSIYERFRYKPTKAKMALSKLKQIERMEIKDKPEKANNRIFKINLKEIEESGKIVLKAKKLTFGYDYPLGTISFEMLRGEKIGIIGSNGIGKSTILKTIASVIPKINGKLEYGTNLKIGYFDQSLAFDDNNKTIFEEFRNMFPSKDNTKLRTMLGSFLFTNDDVFKTINVLSGGEKVRLKLCEILYNKPNLLLLDEPTNHMDILGKERLEDILTGYNGSIIFVSHDRYFINKIATSLIVFENNEVKYYNCNYEYYLKNRKVENPSFVEVQKIPNKQVAINKSKNITKEINKIENEIIKLEEKIGILNKKLLDEKIYSNYEEALKIKRDINNLEEIKKELEKKWESFI